MSFETPKMSGSENNDDKSLFERIRKGKAGKTAKAIALIASLAGPASAEAFDTDNTSREMTTSTIRGSREQGEKNLFSGTIPHTGEPFSIQMRKEASGNGEDFCSDARIFVGGEEWTCQAFHIGEEGVTIVVTKTTPFEDKPGKSFEKKLLLRFPLEDLHEAKNAPRDSNGLALPYYSYSESHRRKDSFGYKPLGNVTGWVPGKTMRIHKNWREE